MVDDVRAIRTGQGRPYTVFTPFYRNWERVSRRPVLDPPERIDMPAKTQPGRVPALVATSSLELGIDMGAVDLVVQIEAPPSVHKEVEVS